MKTVAGLLALVALATAAPNRDTNEFVERAIPEVETILDQEKAWPPTAGLARRMTSIARVERAMQSLEILERALDGPTPTEAWVAARRERLQAQIQRIRARALPLLQAMRTTGSLAHVGPAREPGGD